MPSTSSLNKIMKVKPFCSFVPKSYGFCLSIAYIACPRQSYIESLPIGQYVPHPKHCSVELLFLPKMKLVKDKSRD